MADPKKEGESRDATTEMVMMLVVLFIVGIAAERVMQYVEYSQYATADPIWNRWAYFFTDRIWPIWMLIAGVLTFLAVAVIMHSYTKLKAIIVEEKEIFGKQKASSSVDSEIIKDNEKWDKVIEHINSANSSDWRLAIIEADIMLEELLRKSGYHGTSIGEMLKAVEPSDFLSIEAAWEAHKTRNSIAHRGADFPLNEREAKHVIALYESVFKEFQLI